MRRDAEGRGFCALRGVLARVRGRRTAHCVEAASGCRGEELPKNDDAARALTERVASSGAPMLASPNKLRAFDVDDLVALRADATRLVAGEAQIAAAYDAWMNADGAKPAYVI